MIDLETLRAEIILGNQADEFFKSDIGRYVIERANESTRNAVEQLKEIDPSDAKAVNKIQLELKGAENALTWINEMIINGRSAYQQIEIMSNNEED